MDKLLILGNNCHVDELIHYAKEQGAYTIVTDNLSVDQSPEKALADEAWDVSVIDIDLLEAKCRKENITAITCGASETCLSANRELCKRLDLPFYISDKAWEITNDKLKFKKICEECGVPTSKTYNLDLTFRKNDLENIEYPVVVKPSDSCSSIGLHICYNEKELIDGYKDAYDKSNTKSVVVEEFVQGDLMSLIYLFIDGEAYYIDSGDDVVDKNDYQVRVFGFTPTRYKKKYDLQIEESVKKMFKSIECNYGVGCVQFISNGERFAILEMNYRLPGGKWPSDELMCKNMLNYILKNQTELPKYEASSNSSYGYAIRLKPGRISEILGLEELKNEIPKIIVSQLKHEGDIIEANTGMRQVFAFVLFACDFSEYDKTLEIIHTKLVIKSDTGEDLLCRYKYDKNGFAVAY